MQEVIILDQEEVKVEFVYPIMDNRVGRNQWYVIAGLNGGSNYVIGEAIPNGGPLDLYSGVKGGKIIDFMEYVDDSKALFRDEPALKIFDGSELNGKAVLMRKEGGYGSNILMARRVVSFYITVNGVLNNEINPISNFEISKMFEIKITTSDYYYRSNTYYLYDGARSDFVSGKKPIDVGFLISADNATMTIKTKEGFGYVPREEMFNIGPGVNQIVFDMKAATHKLSSSNIPMHMNKMTSK